MVKEGCNEAIKMEPLRYLDVISIARVAGVSPRLTQLQMFCSPLLVPML
jgi:hypothetical protein